MRRISRLITVSFLTGLCLAGCASVSEPANVGDLKTRLLEYKNSGAYDHDVAAIDAEAKDYVNQRAHEVAHPAIVLDIDETSLSNWPAIKANDFGNLREGSCDHLPKGPCGFKAWQAMAKDEAIVPTLDVFKTAESDGVTVFFITGRDEKLRAATEKNLHAAGYDHWQALIMRPAGTMTPSAADYKAPQRAQIEAAGYTIIVNIGDQPSDLAGGHAERSFLLPDPFYRIP